MQNTSKFLTQNIQHYFVTTGFINAIYGRFLVRGKVDDNILYIPYFYRALIYIKTNNDDAAILDLSSILNLNLTTTDPKLAQIYLLRGKLYGTKNMFNNAINDCSKAISLTSQKEDLAEAYRCRAILYHGAYNCEAANKDYKKACELGAETSCKKTCIPDYLKEGVKYIDNNSLNPSLAITYFNKALNINPKDSLAYMARGLAYELQGNCDQANKDYKKACTLGYSNGCTASCPNSSTQPHLQDFADSTPCEIHRGDSGPNPVGYIRTGQNGWEIMSGYKQVGWIDYNKGTYGWEIHKGDFGPDQIGWISNSCRNGFLGAALLFFF